MSDLIKFEKRRKEKKIELTELGKETKKIIKAWCKAIPKEERIKAQKELIRREKLAKLAQATTPITDIHGNLILSHDIVKDAKKWKEGRIL